MKKFLSFLFVLCALVITSPSFAANATVDQSLTSDDVYEINNATPGTSKTFLGTRLQGSLVKGSTSIAATDFIDGKTCGGAPNQTAYVTPTTKAFIITSGSTKGQSYCLGDGIDGQDLILVGVSISKSFTVTPATKTGFAKIVVDTTNDSATLEFKTTTGWVIVGNNAATVS